MDKKVIIYGTGQMGKMLYYDSLNHPTFKVVCFTAEEKYITEEKTLFNLPVKSVTEVLKAFPPDRHKLIVADGRWMEMSGRVEVYNRVKTLGYQLTNYVSSLCNIEPGVVMGENNIVFSYSHLGYDGVMGNNNIVRQHVYLGHEFKIGDHNVFGPASSVGGRCFIENRCYIGLGATVINTIKLAEETLVGAGSVVIKNTEPYSVNVGNPSRIIRYSKNNI